MKNNLLNNKKYMNNELIVFEEKFKIRMSDKSEFNISGKEMKRFEMAIMWKWLFKKEDWTLINPSYFITAEPFKHLEMSEYEARRIEEKNQSIWWKATIEQKQKWLAKLRNWIPLFN